MAPAPARSALVHLHAAGVSLLVDVTDGRSPAVLHWGAALPDLGEQEARGLRLVTTPVRVENTVDAPLRTAILPQAADGWPGRPGIDGGRIDGTAFSPRLITRSLTSSGRDLPLDDSLHDLGATALTIDLEDPDSGLAVQLEIEMLPSGLLRQRARLTNTGQTPYSLRSLTLTLPTPLEADEILDFAGRWGKERTPQRREMTVGMHLRETHKGRTGFDSAYLLHVGRRGFGFRRGEVWAVHTAFSGNHVHLAERTPTGLQVIGGGELLMAGEGLLGPDESYDSPWVYGAWSADGLDTIAHRFHRYLRSRPQHVSTDRPVSLNVWEAVYFDHDRPRLTDLADRAAALGVERYVLDDGWFGSRRDDTSGLGDWVVSPDVWSDGLAPLAEHVTGLGMQFGLWFEPEMVNEDSDVARAHPDWLLTPSAERLPVQSRHQQVLDLTNPAAYAHLRDQMVAVIESAPISYLKWDHNRDLLEPGSRRDGQARAAAHAQTLAAYRLMDELKERFPGLEIESCSSGGGRIDLGVLERTDRVWVSDCIDPLERQQMQRWTAQLIPLELMGCHVASGRSHTTGRLHSLDFRAGTALFGHMGIEWDLAQATEEELTALRAWIEVFQQRRELLFTGDLVRADRSADPQTEESLSVQGVVAADGSEGLFAVASLRRSGVSPRERVRLPGLDPYRAYTVQVLMPGGTPSGWREPAWMADAADGHAPVLSGRALEMVGLAAPLLDAEQLVLLEVTADDGR
ncbi:alpha-galactosidase [Brachybacterium sp. EF45031]|nr:alpha-galactosidase [Brachybacterium sillae]